jgi:cell division protein FtsB
MSRRRESRPRSLGARIAIAIGALLAIIYAVQGGEWGTSDLFRQRGRLSKVRHDVDSLAREVDSLRRYRKALATDPALQERIAREEFGMVRGNKELLYRFTEPAARDSAPRARPK